MSTVDSWAVVCGLSLGKGDGIGRYGVGLGSGAGGSSSIGKVAGFLLFIVVFLFCRGWHYGCCHEFFSA